jgi:hypothetical protein
MTNTTGRTEPETYAAYWEQRARLDDAQKDALRDVARAVANAKHWEDQLYRSVLQAREAGLSWQWIADDLGTTRQAAQQRFAKWQSGVAGVL